VRDHEAFSAKHMPDLGHDVKDFKVFSWRLSNWRKLEKKLTSPEFECGGHKWRILLFPFGNSNAPPNDTVSVYLDYAEPKKAPEGWHACAQFALVISNIHDPTVYTVSRAYLYYPSRLKPSRCDSQTLTIVSSRRSAIGVLLDSASCVNYLTCRKGILDRPSKRSLQSSQSMFGCWRIPRAFSGITL